MAKKFLRNLQYGVGFSLMVLILSSVASFFSYQRQINNREELAKSKRAITAMKDVMIALLDAETGNRGYQLTGKANFLEPYNASMTALPKAMENAAAQEISDENQRKRITSLEDNVNKRISKLKQFVDRRKNGIQMSEADMLVGKVDMDICRKIVREFVKYEEGILAKKDRSLNTSTTTTIIFILFSTLAAVVVTIFFYFKLRGDLLRREKLERQLKTKDLEISRRVTAIKDIANRVAEGDYSQKAVDHSQDDLGDLAESLNEMTESLKKSFDLINASDWRQKGLAALNESLVGNKTLKDVSQESLNHLITYGNCLNGAIYLLEDGVLKLSSAFGLEKSMKPVFEPGEGMVGQTFLKKKVKIFNDLQNENFTATFAGSEMVIKSICLLPIMSGRHIYGILELSASENFDENSIQYFTEGAANIAVAVNAARGREKEQRLLEETQTQSEELQVQHSELESLNTELEVQTQKLQASEEELKVQQEELMQINAELEERSKSLEEKNHLIAERNIEIQKKAEELALSTKYKSEFLANMSHELRTPLNSILLLSRLMAENSEENLNDDQVESAKVIQSSGTSLLQLIDEILDLAKIESGKMSLENVQVKISDVAEDMKRMFQPLVTEKGLEFNIKVAEETAAEIETDRMRLDQVLRNLLSNALKFTSKGKIDLEILPGKEKKNCIIFKVKDSGIGIPKDKQAVIFEAFQQADGSTRRKFGGTGLGLSISREIAKLLGGELILESEPNVGSEFSLIIPVKNSGENVHKTAEKEILDVIQHDVEEIVHLAEESGDAEKVRTQPVLFIPDEIEDDRAAIQQGDKVILIVEDDTNFAKALVKYSRKNGYKTVAVVRGDYALEAAKKYKPIAVLLDVQLPVMDGWQVMEALKSDPEVKNIPVHMMSVLQVEKESMMRGAVDFISKSMALDQMGEVFKKLEDALKRSPKVLIVEENAKHASALSYFLNNFNISLSVENNVQDSVKALTENDKDCVILDVGASKGNEYQIVEEIKSYEGLENLPIIIFTERSLSAGEELKIREYADSIVVKTAHSYQRILDEVGLFLHLVKEKNTQDNYTSGKNLGSLAEVLKGKKILITDDDARNIFSLSKALEKYQVEVVIAMDGRQALEQMAANSDIDVVLMDMMMPEMDGYETIRQLRKNRKYSDLPIIAVTAKSMAGDRQKCIDAGASDYISKPVDLDQLLSLLRVWLYEN
ncbi:histidine kinase [Chryseobacterium sp. Leaf404]|uniref:response regulator n=1 Tax=unclassified Chryseobacterium TaxID=2593645 RepID=UPI0006F60681|nr:MULTISPECIES: response regulator [unclassified Chryseobacterium]KQT16930.1 histidine kinase [Chryseobacterium sp. Leaf404]